MGNNNTGLDKVQLEREWANAEARLKLSKEDRNKWAEMGYTIRPFVYFDKILVAWTVVKGEPQVKDIFTVTSLDASFQGGVWVKAKGKVSGHEALFTHTPQRLAPGLDIFAWVPYFNEMRFASQDWNNLSLPRHMRLSMCFKMEGNPLDIRLREGAHYLSELHVFRSEFPQYANTKF